MSIHPTTTTEEITFVCDSILKLAKDHEIWAKDYDYDRYTNEFIHKTSRRKPNLERVDNWFNL